jgi:hypothetical protein
MRQHPDSKTAKRQKPTEIQHLDLVRFCAIECELQRSGERSVFWMVQAWVMALGWDGHPGPEDIIELGRIVEPVKNRRGFRECGVRVGSDVKGDWSLVPRQIDNLCEQATIDELTPAEWFREYEEVHPFIDGNGRTGQILFNWFNRTLDTPVWAPNFWDDPRRVAGDGA